MTGRMYLQPADAPLPKHAAVWLNLGLQTFIYEDQRYFGRLTLAAEGLDRLGPEPLSGEFTSAHLAAALRRSAQPVKVKLLDQKLVAGIGNIYASEALFRAGISPRLAARRLTAGQVWCLWRAIRAVLREAIACGSTIPLNFRGGKAGDRLFYYGRAAGAADYYAERLRVYDRAGQPCGVCATPIRRVIQAARSTFYCPECQ
jgi:formamidopyrimidine-DNA glycosylase